MGMQLHVLLTCKGDHQQVRKCCVFEVQYTTQLHGCKLSNIKTFTENMLLEIYQAKLWSLSNALYHTSSTHA